MTARAVPRIALCMAVIGGALAGAAPAALAQPDLVTARYVCERGVGIPATVVTGAEGSVAVLNVEGRQITLVGTPTATGMRFAWPSDGSGYVWRTADGTATLSWFEAGASEEVVLLKDCRIE